MKADTRFVPKVTPLEDRTVPAAGDLNPTFAGGGRVIVTSAGEAVFNDVAVVGGDKIVAVGTVTNPGTDILVARFNSNGTPDTSFDGDGFKTIDIDGGADAGNAVAVLADGTILIAGRTTGASGKADAALVRVSADGSTVTARTRDFGGAGGDNEANAIGVNRTTGDIYLTGGVAGQTFAVYRFDAGLNFVAETAPNLDGAAYALALDSAGRLFVAGPGGGSKFVVARLNADLGGLVSKTFEWAGTVPGPLLGAIANRVAFNPATGSVVVGGSVLTTTTDARVGVLRLDTELVEQARTTLRLGAGTPYDRIALDGQGRVVVVGTTGTGGTVSSTGSVVAARLAADSLAPDAKFNGGAVRVYDFGGGDLTGAVTTNSRGEIVIVGTNNPNGSIAVAGNKPELVVLLGDLPAAGGGGGPVAATVGTAVVGGPAGGVVRVLDASAGRYVLGQSLAPIPGFAGDVRVAAGDVTGDGTADIVAGTGPGGPTRVVVVDGKTGATVFDVPPFEAAFTGGVFVGAADLNGDGKAEVFVTPDQGGGPVVAVYAGTGGPVNRFFGIEDANFRGGARAAAGDVNGDGTPDLVVSAGFQGGPRIAVYDGIGIGKGQAATRLVPDFFAFESTLRNGAFVAVGDVDGDGKADLAFGGGPSGGPRVRLVNGASLLAAPPVTLDDPAAASLGLANFFAGDSNLRGGVRIVLRDIDGNGRADLVTGSGEREPSRVRLYLASTLLAGGAVDQELDPFGDAMLASGVFVG